VEVHGNDYVSTALSINSQRPSSTDFYLLEASSNAASTRQFYIRGDGMVEGNRMVVSGGSVGGIGDGGGGLTIESTGLTDSRCSLIESIFLRK